MNTNMFVMSGVLVRQEFFSMVVNETAHMIAKWMSVGFAHGELFHHNSWIITLQSSSFTDHRRIFYCLITGVCNTDNFSLLSITLDYGPFGFMESYNPSKSHCISLLHTTKFRNVK